MCESSHPVSSIALRKIIAPLHYSRRYHLECEICADDSKQIIFNTKHRPAKISEINLVLFQNNIVPDETIFLGPCGNHAICKECLVRTIMNTESPPINSQFSMIPCLSLTLGECKTKIGTTIFFDSNHIKKILLPKQFSYYYSLEQRFRFPGFEVIKCPMGIMNHTEICNAENIIPIKDIQTIPRGQMIITCTQNKNCRKQYCYYCFRIVEPLLKKCIFCSEFSENMNPLSFNHYYYKCNNENGEMLFYRNEELTLEIVISQIREIAIAPRTFVKCFICLIPILKSEQCNGLSHCGTEICYACGKSAKCGSTLQEHWSASGKNGCPRWDHDPYWNKIANCNFKCIEGECYGEYSDGICFDVTHQQGIKNLDTERKKAMIYHKIISIPSEIRSQVVKTCLNISEISMFIPSESILKFVKENNVSIVHTVYSEIIIFSEWFKTHLKM